MPVPLKLPLPGGTILALWRIDEEEPPLASLCTVAEQQEAAAFAAPRRLEYLAWHALLHALLPEAHAAHDPEGGPVLVFPSSGQNTPADIPGGLPHRQNCIRPDTGLHKNARSDNIPFEHTRFGDPLQTGEFAPLRHIGVSHSHGYAAVILSARWTSSLPTRISPARRGASSPRRNRRYNRAPFPKSFSPHWSGVQRRPYINGYG